MLAADFSDIFSQEGFAFLSRWGHVLVGITWIGLLYFFNFVQVPAFAEMEAAARNNAMDKLTWRALWWFRWAAVATFVTGILIIAFSWDAVYGTDGFWSSASGISISTGMLLGITMLLNVWGVIWRNQKVVIANARNVQAGGEADPNAAAAGRRALMASRQNTIFSLPMLLFMVGTSHFFFRYGEPESGKRISFWIVTVLIWGLLELNALGVFGTSQGGTRAIYDNHRNAIITGFVYFAVMLVAFTTILST